MPIADVAGNPAPDFTDQSATNSTDPQSFCLAIGAGTLDVSPLWTRIDSAPDIRIQHVSIRRGRSDEREQTPIGEATISGIDTGGALDPTNPASPFFGGADTLIDPVTPASYALRNPVTGNYVTIFRGYLDDFEYDLDLSGKFATFEIKLVDALDLLADAEVIPGGAGDTSYSSSGDAVYLAQSVQARIEAGLADAALSAGVTEWPADLMEIFTGNVDVQKMSYAPRSKILSVLQDAAQAEWPGAANLFVSKTGVVTFHGRLARFNPENPDYGIHDWKVGDWPAVYLTSDTALISGLTLSRSKDNLINAALVTPQGIADADIAGQFVSDATSIAKFGARSISFENLVTLQGTTGGLTPANDEVKKYGKYYVDNYATTKTRVSSVKFRPVAPDSLPGAATWNLICNVEISDLFSLSTTHSWGGGVFADYFVEGLTYDIVPGNKNFAEVTLTADLSPRALFPDGYVFTT